MKEQVTNKSKHGNYLNLSQLLLSSLIYEINQLQKCVFTVLI